MKIFCFRKENVLIKKNFLGYPIGGDTDYRHILIEVHYNDKEESLSNKINEIKMIKIVLNFENFKRIY